LTICCEDLEKRHRGGLASNFLAAWCSVACSTWRITRRKALPANEVSRDRLVLHAKVERKGNASAIFQMERLVTAVGRVRQDLVFSRSVQSIPTTRHVTATGDA
jgi:hypothetical protein